MSQLTEQKCEACHRDAPLVSPEQAQKLLTEIPGWTCNSHQSIDKLLREFKFKNFRQALAFSNRVAELAEAENHHPTLVTEWGKVTVYWWTHKINGLHNNDFIMAAKTDSVYAVD